LKAGGLPNKPPKEWNAMENEFFTIREQLLFKTPAADFSRECFCIRDKYSKEMEVASELRRQEIADIITGISIDLQSYLTRWNLQDLKNHEILPQCEITGEVEKNYSFLEKSGFQTRFHLLKTKLNYSRTAIVLKSHKWLMRDLSKTALAMTVHMDCRIQSGKVLFL
jgi:hypothetical protein